MVHASDRQIFDAVADLISVYSEQLAFSTDEQGNNNLSPFDVFLEQNGLPRQPSHGTDLGVWNVFANPDFPKPQARLRQILCDEEIGASVPPFLVPFLARCGPARLLLKSVAVFKTPVLRDLSHSAPYMHNGQLSTLAGVIDLYRQTSTLARAQTLRNGAKQLEGIALRAEDVAPLVAFLRSLNEDYQ